MLPRSNIWQELRSRGLTTVADGVAIRSHVPATIADWLSAGAYTVQAKSSTRLELDAVSIEVGSAFLGDAHLYLDSATEHSIFLRHVLSSGRWSSAGWVLISVYYWAFYQALSLSRLLGRSVIFLDRTRARGLSIMAGRSYGAGAYELSVLAGTATGRVLVDLKKSTISRVHDLLWRVWARTLAELVANGASADNIPEEQSLFEALFRPYQRLGDAWPSELRNAANYSPNEGYRSVRRLPPIFDVSGVATDPAILLSDCANRLALNSLGLSNGSVRSQATLATKVLIDSTFIGQQLLEELCLEIVERRHLDRRWTLMRSQFKAQQSELFGDPSWPVR